MNTTQSTTLDLPSLRKAALTAGLAILIMALTVPLVEFYIFPKLVDYKNAEKTFNNISQNSKLFSASIFIHFITIICDTVIAWALYIFLKPVNKNLSLLAAWFRLVYTGFNIAALLNLVQISSIVSPIQSVPMIPTSQIHDFVLMNINSFNHQWRFGLVFFGIYLLLLGYLVYKAPYVPRIVGAFLILAGLGYLVDQLKVYFYPTLNTLWLWFTYFGELIFMLWLLIKGSRLQIKTLQSVPAETIPVGE
jgi:hypothetical protein